MLWILVNMKVGANGTGKTTLLKILLGELHPVHGVHHTHRSLRVGYFSQHHVDQLDMNVSSVQVLEEKFPGLYFVRRKAVNSADYSSVGLIKYSMSQY